MGIRHSCIVVALGAAVFAGPAIAEIKHPEHDAIVAKMKAMGGEWDLPMATLKQRAAAGDLRAMFALALMYQSGLKGLKQSFAEAERLNRRIIQLATARAASDPYAAYQVALQRSLLEGWSDERRFAAYLAAAQAGSPQAAERVGWAYFFGRGVRMDKAEALRWYRIAAAGGYCDAIRDLGHIFGGSDAGEPDIAEAVRWYRIAAEDDSGCGNAAAYYLAGFYSKGVGNVQRDYGEALKWYLETARRGNPVGAMQIGFYYEKGLGTPVNKAEALKWFKIAGFNSVAAARAELKRLGVPEPE